MLSFPEDLVHFLQLLLRFNELRFRCPSLVCQLRSSLIQLLLLLAESRDTFLGLFQSVISLILVIAANNISRKLSGASLF